MQLNRLQLINFKNYPEAELEFAAGINCFVGSNGEGKTNLLDAIYYLAFCKSYFNPIDSQNIRYQEAFLMVQGVFERLGKEEVVHCGIKRNTKKQFKRNKKDYERLADHIGFLPLVMISPSDTALVLEGSETRRKFLDGVIAQCDKKYLDQLINYSKVVTQRNSLLKRFAEMRQFDAATLEVWDDKLVEYGQPIFERRKEFLEAFTPLFQKHFQAIAGGKEEVELVYESKMHEEDLQTLLTESLGKDRARQYTSVGVHKDDLRFLLGEYPIKKFGSQGQQKSYLIALKLAQYDYLKQEKSMQPILLLDDIFDKLDETRVAALMELVDGPEFGQVFITDTHRDRLATLFNERKMEFSLFAVSQNQVQAV